MVSQFGETGLRTGRVSVLLQICRADGAGERRCPWVCILCKPRSGGEYILHTPDGIAAGTNHCESFFSLLKRGVHGAWHNVSREHLQKYTNEFQFRWNTRKLTDGARMAAGIPMVEGKRLFYRRPE